MKAVASLWVCALAVCVGVSGNGWASGPMTHLREGDAYLELAVLQGSVQQETDAEAIEETQTEDYFLLGTMFPDINGAIDDLGFSTHDRVLGKALLAAARAPGAEAWMLSFALGYEQHLCTDISAQLFQTQSLSIFSGLGEVDLFDGMMDDHMGGEDELLVEVAIDFYYGNVNELLSLLEYFILDRRTGADRFFEVVDFWYETALSLHGGGIISEEELNAELTSFVSIVDSLEIFIREHLIVRKLRQLRSESLGDILGQVMPLVNRILLIAGGSSLSMDLDELERLSDTPFFADPHYFSWYLEDFAWLGPHIHLNFEENGLWYKSWPTWDEKIMQAAGFQGLATAYSSRLAESSDLLVSRMAYVDTTTGAALTSVPSGNLPTRIRAEVEIFATLELSDTVTVAVKSDKSGGYGVDTLCAESSSGITLDPANYGVTPRPLLSVSFEPGACLSGGQGFYVEVRRSSSGGKPFYSAAWEAYQGVPDRDLEQVPYQLLYAPVSSRSGYLPLK